MPKIGEPGAPTPGRQKGAVNKTTALLKDAILKAAQAAGGGSDDGMVKYLTEQATANPGPFLSLLGKVLPLQIAGTDEDGEVTELRLTIVDPRR
jgi:hypothetical protein